MFAAVLIVCSLDSTTCNLMGTDPIFGTELACRENAAEYLVSHAEQLKRAFGPYAVSLWCREVQGRPA
jgi:hypothetical protein